MFLFPNSQWGATAHDSRVDPDLSPREEDNPTKGMTHSFRSILDNDIISAEAVVSNLIKIGKNNVQLGDIFAKVSQI